MINPMILITPPNDYKRFEGKNCTHHVQSENRSLSASEVELLRKSPEDFFSCAEYPDSPEAA